MSAALTSYVSLQYSIIFTGTVSSLRVVLITKENNFYLTLTVHQSCGEIKASKPPGFVCLRPIREEFDYAYVWMAELYFP